MLSSEMNVTVQQAANRKSEHVCVSVQCMVPGEKVHVVGHAGQALALPDNVVFLFLPLFHLCVHV